MDKLHTFDPSWVFCFQNLQMNFLLAQTNIQGLTLLREKKPFFVRRVKVQKAAWLLEFPFTSNDLIGREPSVKPDLLIEAKLITCNYKAIKHRGVFCQETGKDQLSNSLSRV